MQTWLRLIVPCDSMTIFIGSNITQTFQQIDTGTDLLIACSSVDIV